jgi:hypothetical protein
VDDALLVQNLNAYSKRSAFARHLGIGLADVFGLKAVIRRRQRLDTVHLRRAASLSQRASVVEQRRLWRGLVITQTGAEYSSDARPQKPWEHSSDAATAADLLPAGDARFGAAAEVDDSLNGQRRRRGLEDAESLPGRDRPVLGESDQVGLVRLLRAERGRLELASKAAGARAGVRKSVQTTVTGA